MKTQLAPIVSFVAGALIVLACGAVTSPTGKADDLTEVLDRLEKNGLKISVAGEVVLGQPKSTRIGVSPSWTIHLD